MSEVNRLVRLITFWGPIMAVTFSITEVAFEPNSFATWLGDGRTFYCAGRAARYGFDPYDLEVITQCGRAMGAPVLPSFFYTPLALAAFVPLSWLPGWLAFILLSVAQAGALIAISRLLAAGVAHGTLALRLGLAAAPSIAYGVTLNLWLGQVNLICAGLIALAAVALQRDKDPQAGALIALAAVLKPGFLLFLALPGALLRWRALAVALAATLAALAVAAMLAPPDAWADHAEVARRIVAEPLPDWMRIGNHAFSGPLSRVNPDPAFIWFWHAIIIGLVGLMTGVAALSAWSLPASERILPVTACAAGFMFLAGPFSWWAHTPLLWLALAAMAPGALRAGLDWMIAALALALMAPMELSEPPIPLLGLYGTGVALAVWGLALGLCLRQTWRPVLEALQRPFKRAGAAH